MLSAQLNFFFFFFFAFVSPSLPLSFPYRVCGLEKLDPVDTIEVLSSIYAQFDEIALLSRLEKVKIDGTTYMIASGVPEADKDALLRLVDFGAACAEIVSAHGREAGLGMGGIYLSIGCHRGPLVAGVLGDGLVAFDIFGDTVNVASRLCTACQPSEMILCSQAVHETLKPMPKYSFRAFRIAELKGKGKVAVFPLVSVAATGQDLLASVKSLNASLNMSTSTIRRVPELIEEEDEDGRAEGARLDASRTSLFRSAAYSMDLPGVPMKATSSPSLKGRPMPRASPAKGGKYAELDHSHPSPALSAATALTGAEIGAGPEVPLLKNIPDAVSVRNRSKSGLEIESVRSRVSAISEATRRSVASLVDGRRAIALASGRSGNTLHSAGTATSAMRSGSGRMASGMFRAKSGILFEVHDPLLDSLRADGATSTDLTWAQKFRAKGLELQFQYDFYPVNIGRKRMRDVQILGGIMFGLFILATLAVSASVQVGRRGEGPIASLVAPLLYV